MKWRKIAAIASYVASLCFYVAFLFDRQIVLMLLGSVWLCVGAVNVISMNKGDK